MQMVLKWFSGPKLKGAWKRISSDFETQLTGQYLWRIDSTMSKNSLQPVYFGSNVDREIWPKSGSFVLTSADTYCVTQYELAISWPLDVQK